MTTAQDLDIAVVLSKHKSAHKCLDGFFITGAVHQCLPYRLADLAQRAERERDEAQAELAKLRVEGDT